MLTDDDLKMLAQKYPTHLGEPHGSVVIQRLLSELRERRTLDLSAEEVEALRAFVKPQCPLALFVDDGFPYAQCYLDAGHAHGCVVYSDDRLPPLRVIACKLIAAAEARRG